MRPDNGEYDTGDIVDMDDDGYVTIKGRAKRFAKIAGEMVSLTAVEGFLADLWPDSQSAVIAIPDSKKGEALVLVTNNRDAKRDTISAFAKKNGVGDLSVPRIINIVDALPVLGTGKTDYVALTASVANSK